MASTATPLLIADGMRGIHAPTFAAQALRRMIEAGNVRYSGHTVSLGDLRDACDTTDGDAQWDAWDNVSRGVYFMAGDDEHEYRIHEDSEGIFLVPEGLGFFDL